MIESTIVEADVEGEPSEEEAEAEGGGVVIVVDASPIMIADIDSCWVLLLAFWGAEDGVDSIMMAASLLGCSEVKMIFSIDDTVGFFGADCCSCGCCGCGGCDFCCSFDSLLGAAFVVVDEEEEEVADEGGGVVTEAFCSGLEVVDGDGVGVVVALLRFEAAFVADAGDDEEGAFGVFVVDVVPLFVVALW